MTIFNGKIEASINETLNDQGEPLSYTQESIWLLHQIAAPDAPAYNESIAFRVEGRLDTAALDLALSQIMLRHDSLRSHFVEAGGQLRALIDREARSVLKLFDAREYSDPEGVASEFIDATVSARFDLARGPLIRAALAQVTETDWIFALVAHHIVVDGWSLGIILRELGEHYQSFQDNGVAAQLPPLEARYADFVAEQRQNFESGEYDGGIEAWVDTFAHNADLLKLPTDRSRPAKQSFYGDAMAVQVARPTVEGLLQQCKRACGSTQYGVFLSAFAVLLQRYTGQDDIHVGTTVLNRMRAEEFDIVGCYVNTAALAFSLQPDTSFRSVLSQANEAIVGLSERQDVPYPKVLERLNVTRDASHNPVFQAMVTALGPRRMLELGEAIVCKPHRTARRGAKFDLLLYVTEDRDTIEFEVEYSTDLFDRSTIARMLDQFTKLLDELGRNIDEEIGSVNILPEAERTTILTEFNDTDVDYPPGDVVSLFEQQVALAPDTIAVEFADSHLTYAELDRRANSIAWFLQASQGNAGGFIGVYMDRSIEMVVALLSVMKAGLAYVPIDPDYPAERVRYMIEDSQVPLTLTQRHHAPALTELNVPHTVLQDIVSKDDDRGPPPRTIVEDSRAYMIYTSGSTGRPKGVINRHGGLFNRLYWMQQQYGLDNSDRVLQKTPFSFDVSVWEFFWPLMFGARIVVAAPGGHRDTDYLKRLIKQCSVTTCHFVPSMLNAFLEEDELATYCGSLRRVFCSGEALAYGNVERFMAQLRCELHNLYGPTEAAIDVSFWPCSLDYPGRIVPIGRPVANTTLYVVDRNLRLQPIGVSGELCIGGVQLAEGYHGRDDLTAAAFVPDPFSTRAGARMYRTGDLARYRADGEIEYLGRIDNQVKLRGFRIELGEIEAVARAVPHVRDAVVLVHERATQRLLVGYFVPQDDQRFDADQAAAHMRQHLPEFMIPQLLVPIESIPVSVNGKLDRKALPNPLTNSENDDGAKPVPVFESQAEQALAQAWAEALGRTTIGPNANFFQLGGDSILSLRIVSRMRELGYAVAVGDLFAYPTVRELAQHLTATTAQSGFESPGPKALVSEADRAYLPPGVEDAWPLSALQSGMIYHSTLHPQSPVYHDIFSYYLHGPVDTLLLRQALRTVVGQRPQLRSVFDLASYSEPLQLVLPISDPEIEVEDLSAVGEPEQDTSLQRWTEFEKRRGFDLEARTPLRFHVQVRGSDQLILTMAFHHAILDGWSVALVVEQIRRVYSDLLQGRLSTEEQERVSYSAFVQLERAAISDPEQGAFWREYVASLPPIEEGKSEPGKILSRTRNLPANLANALQALSARAGVPMRTALLAAHFGALKQVPELRGNDDENVVTGMVFNGRPEVAGADAVAGLFLNTLPVKLPLTTRDEPVTKLRRLFSIEQEMLRYRRYPLSHILSGRQSRSLFRTVFNFTNFHVYGDAQTETVVRITGARYFEQTSFPLVLHAHQDAFTGMLGLVAVFDASQFTADMVDSYLDAYMQSARALCDTAPTDSELVRQLCDTIAAALGGIPIGPDDDYVARGVDSITAVRIVARLKREGLHIDLQRLLGNNNVRSLAASLDSEVLPGAAANPPGQESERIGAFELATGPRERFSPGIVAAYPATAIQALMIRENDADPAQGRYHDVFAYKLRISLDIGRLSACLQRLVDKHDLLRTAFELEGWPEVTQLVHAYASVRLDKSDLRDLTREKQSQEILAWMERERGTAFDWRQPQLMRFHVFDEGQGGFTLGIGFHHAIIDGWSLSQLVAELINDYRQDTRSVSAKPSTSLCYRDYVDRERRDRRSPDLQKLWREELQDAVFASLPHWPGSQSTRWSETKHVLPDDLTAALMSTASEKGVGIKHVLLAAHLATMSLVQNQTDVVTCAFAGGRLEEENSEHIIGMFLNFLPVRVNLFGLTCEQLIRACHDAEQRTLPGRRYSLVDIQNDQDRDWIAESVFNYTRFAAYADLADGVLERTDWFEHAHFPLLANFGHDVQLNHLVLTLNADGRRICQDALDGLAEIYLTLLRAIVTDGDVAALQANPTVVAALSTLARYQRPS